MTGINSLEYRIEQYLRTANGMSREQLARAIAFQCENGCKFEAGDFRVRKPGPVAPSAPPLAVESRPRRKQKASA